MTQPTPTTISVPTASDYSLEQLYALALNDLPAADLPEFHYCDGPNGIRSAQGATAFSSGLAVAAAFDVSLAETFGQALGREALQDGRNAILASELDIARVPWAGRIAEALGEAPILVGDIGAAIVRGVQNMGVLAVLQHFVANNFRFDVELSSTDIHTTLAIELPSRIYPPVRSAEPPKYQQEQELHR